MSGQPLVAESIKGSTGSHVKPAVGGKEKAGVSDQLLVAEPFNDLPLLPEFSCSGSEGQRKRKSPGGDKHKQKLPGAQASPSIPWRSLPYLRQEALPDIRAVADILR